MFDFWRGREVGPRDAPSRYLRRTSDQRQAGITCTFPTHGGIGGGSGPNNCGSLRSSWISLPTHQTKISGLVPIPTVEKKHGLFANLQWRLFSADTGLCLDNILGALDPLGPRMRVPFAYSPAPKPRFIGGGKPDLQIICCRVAISHRRSCCRCRSTKHRYHVKCGSALPSDVS